MVERVRSAVVKITTDESTGSGAIFDIEDTTGFVITNHHVVGDFSRVTVTVNDSTTYWGQVLGTDTTRDLAVITICCGSFTALSFGGDDIVQVGDAVISMGYPLGLPGAATVTKGIVSARRYSSYHGAYVVQTDAPINPGNSGGPMLSMDGKIVGINTFKYEETQDGRPVEGLGFAIAATSVTERLGGLRSAAPKPTPTAGPTATVTPERESGYLFGPIDGEIAHDPTNGSIQTGWSAGVDVADVDVEAVFINPYPTYAHKFSHGIIVRDNRNVGNLVFALSDNGFWRVWYWSDKTQDHEYLLDDFTDIPFGRNEGDEIHLRVVVKGELAWFYVNYTQVHGQAIWVGHADESGDVYPATGVFSGSEREGAVTRYREFKGRVPR